MNSIWSTIKHKKNEEQPPIEKELTEEIKQFREKKKVFDASNQTQTFVVVCFSTIEDRKKFMRNVLPKNEEDCYIDGYKLAQAINIDPKFPTIRLPKPLK